MAGTVDMPAERSKLMMRQALMAPLQRQGTQRGGHGGRNPVVAPARARPQNPQAPAQQPRGQQRAQGGGGAAGRGHAAVAGPPRVVPVAACYSFLKHQLRMPNSNGCSNPGCIREHVIVGATVSAAERRRLEDAFGAMAVTPAKTAIMTAIAGIPPS